MLALYDPEVEWDYTRGPVGSLIGRDVYRGHEGLRRWFREWHEAWENVQYKFEELIDASDRVISVGTVSGCGRASKIEVALKQAGVWTIREGRVVRVVWFSTRDEALEAAGLSE